MLYNLFDYIFEQDWWLSLITSYGVSLMLNLMPLIIASNLLEIKYNLSRYAKASATILTLTFCILFLATAGLRFAYQEKYKPTEQSYLKNEMAISAETLLDESQVPVASSDPKTLATVVLLSIEPLVSSVINGALSYNSGGALKRKIKHLRRRKLQLMEQRNQLQMYIDTAIDPKNRRDQLLAFDLERKEKFKILLSLSTAILKSDARLYLAEIMKSPEDISYVTHSNQ